MAEISPKSCSAQKLFRDWRLPLSLFCISSSPSPTEFQLGAAKHLKRDKLILTEMREWFFVSSLIAESSCQCYAQRYWCASVVKKGMDFIFCSNSFSCLYNWCLCILEATAWSCHHITHRFIQTFHSEHDSILIATKNKLPWLSDAICFLCRDWHRVLALAKEDFTFTQ